MASLRLEDISLRYHLPTPTCALSESFLKGFTQSNKGLVKLMKHWWDDKDETLKQGQKLVPTHRIKTPYKMLVVMLCQLYGEDKSTHFKIDWLPQAHIIVKTRQVFNWENILAFNICLHMNNILGIKKPCFYISTYLIDAICSSMQFIDLGLKWDQNQPLIHVYYSEL
jgi:hypothetical protein